MSNRNSGSKSGGNSKRNADNSNSNMGYDVEQQFILRLPHTPAARLASEIEMGVSMKDRLGLVFNQDMRHIEIRYGAKSYPGKLVDLPCMIESLKTTDKKTFYKTGDICQMLICREEEDEEEEKRKQAEQDMSPRKKEKLAEKQFIYNHGITPPLKNVRKKRFRKTMKKKFLDMPEIEKEVKRLLRVDLEAQEVKWEVVFEDDTQPQTSQSLNSTRIKEEVANPDMAKLLPEESMLSSEKPVKESAAKSSEIFGYLSSDEEEEEDERKIKVEAAIPTGDQEGEEGAETAGSILERACRIALTEEDLRPFTEVTGVHGDNDMSGAGMGMSGSVDQFGFDAGIPVDSETENRLHERMVELTGEIERLKAFINVRESQLPNLEHEKFRERLQQDIDSYNEQLSECRREFERLSGQLEAIARSRC